MTCLRPITAALAILLVSPALHAATLVWPDLFGGGVCAGTLQACVDAAAAGDTVVIGADEPFTPDAYTAINEHVFLGKSLTLTAQPGIDAVFGPGFNVVFEPTVPGPHQVTVSGLVLRRGSVEFRDTGTAAGSVFRAERLHIVEPAAPNVIGCAINFQLASPSPQIIAGDNQIRSGAAAGENRFGICAYASTATTSYSANVFRNRIVAEDAAVRFGISLNAGVAGGNFVVSANTVLGPRLVDGIALQRSSGSAALTVQVDNNVVALQDESTGRGIKLELGNSVATVVNNTVVHGRSGLRVTGFGALPVSGRVANNLVAFHTMSGVVLDGGALGNSHNLVFANTLDSFTPGPSTLTVDPQIELPAHPRLASGSPAIDAGNAADVPALALFDADGERRTVFGAVDIGAYEANGDGAARIVATPATAFFNEVYVTPFPVNLVATDTLVATARHTTWPMGVSALNLGVYPNPAGPSGWSVFLQQSALEMPLGAELHVLAPFAGKTGFEHTTAAGNVSGPLSTIDHPALNGALNRATIAVALHRWDGVYHDVPIGLRWVSSGGGRWQVRNEDGVGMQAGLTFNLAVAPFLSPNAFRTTTNAFAQSQWPLEHRLLDANPCAAPIVGRADDPDVAGDVTNSTGFGVQYLAPSGPGAPGRWVVRADATTPSPTFPPNASFHVIIDGAQANRCRAPVPVQIFADGFE